MGSGQWDDNLILTHTGEDSSRYCGAVVPPVHLTSLHVFESMDRYMQADPTQQGQYVYGRTGNPTVQILESKMAALERGVGALAFSSGMAAATTAILACCGAGEHVICVRNSYTPVKRFLEQYCQPYLGIEVSYVMGDRVEEVEAAIRPQTKLIILESPSTFLFSLCDLQAIGAMAQARGITTYVDNTYCTPLYQKPLELGIDIVMHTASKYLGGHSDIIGGILAVKDAELLQRLYSLREWYGGILGPMEGWLVLRGMRTLAVRLEQHSSTALAVAGYLSSHPKVRAVHYPGLASHPQFALMQRQQTGNTGLLSLELDTDPQRAKAFVDRLEFFQIGCSWGGFESLALMPLLTETPQQLEIIGMDRGLIRIHCGLEGSDNLLADLEQALQQL